MWKYFLGQFKNNTFELKATTNVQFQRYPFYTCTPGIKLSRSVYRSRQKLFSMKFCNIQKKNQPTLYNCNKIPSRFRLIVKNNSIYQLTVVYVD